MLEIRPLPAFVDNYIWMLSASNTEGVFVVDPGDAAVVEAALREHRLSLAGILITHHHFDHTGGVAELIAKRDIAVYGPKVSAITDIDRRLSDGDRIEVLGHEMRVLEVPGHTLDHIAYYCPDAEPAALFCGDTLFAAGCGRLFEGDARQMWDSLNRLAALPEDTLIYPAHEYTLANLDFALQVEPDSDALLARRKDEQRKREQQRPTLPASLALELVTNPFLRCAESGPRAAASQRSGVDLSERSPLEIFTELRRWKDVV